MRDKTKYTTEELCYIWIDGFSELEYKHKKNLIELISGKKDIKKVIESGKDYIISEIGEDKFRTISMSATPQYLDYLLAELKRKEVYCITQASEEYPDVLLQTEIPPLVLYAKGESDLLKENLFGIVGSRKSLPLSVKIAENYTEKLIGYGFVPVTGIAEGIDKAVLETALRINGKAISVLAGGFDNVYPVSHTELFNKLSEKGLCISEHCPEVKALPYLFPIRNRIISGLARGVLIVSGAKKSGTLYTAEYAEEYGKDLFCVPYSVGISSGAGCNDLIKRGAILTDDPKDIADFYGITDAEEKTELTKEELIVTECLKDGEKHIEKIAKETGKAVYEISPILSMLEIKGYVVKSGVNVYTLLK